MLTKYTIATVLLAYLTSAQFNTTNDYTCNPVNNCNARGICHTDDDGDWYCICDDGYDTYPEITDQDDDSVYCNYKQKKQLTAFLLSWFLGVWGGGQWYIGLNALAGAKLAMGIVFCCCSCCAQIFAEQAGEMAMPLLGCTCCGWCGIFAWWLVDIIRFGMNWYEDKNGVGLEEW